MPDTLQQTPSAKPEPTLSMRSQSRRILFIEFGFCAAVALCLTAMMLGPDGTLDPGALAAWSGDRPTWARGLRAAILLAFLAVEFDLAGRLVALLFARKASDGTATRRRQAKVRFAVLSVLLALIPLGNALAPRIVPLPHGWALAAFLGCLALPAALSAAEWMRSRP